jgi:asparagine synthase (glutamine-hydrolysing)
MCGILGELCKDTTTDEATFKGLLNMSRHRGPDAQQIWAEGKVRFGFNRLSILDTSIKGMQPIISPSGRFVVMLNGEIYNYKQLQTKYGIKNERLRSGSDAEVVAQLTEIVDKLELPRLLNGMFAFALYDKVTKELVLARDFAGIKPLFYGKSENSVVFASQFDQVFTHPSFKRNLKISKNGLKDYMTLGFMQAPNTVFENVYQVKPGEVILFTSKLDGKNIQDQFYSAFDGSKKYNETDKKTAEVFRNTFTEVIREQLVSDVPLSSFLSGGIDSPLVTAIAHLYKPDIKAFTFNVNAPHLSELEQARLYSKSIDVKLVEETLYPSSVIKLCDEHFNAYSEPFGDPSSLPTYILTKLARKYSTVMLSGDGGDELFWGYPRFMGVCDYGNYFKYPRPIRKVLASARRLKGDNVSYGVSAFATIGEWQLNKHTHLSLNFINKIFGKIEHSAEVLNLYSFDRRKYNNSDLLNWLRWNEFYSHLQRVLIKVDRASMFNSLEIRVPFLDRRVINLSWQINPELVEKHREPKSILKNAMLSFYPKDVIYKSKKGFSIPFESYLANELRSDLSRLIFENKLFGSEYYDEKLLREYVSNYINLGQGSGWGVWIIYALQKWALNYNLI